MSPDLHIPLQRGRSVEEIFSLEYGIRAVFSPDLKESLFSLFLFPKRVVVREQVQLEDAEILFGVERTDAKPSVKQPMVCFFVKGAGQPFRNEAGGAGRHFHFYRSARVLRVEPSVEIDGERPVVFRAFLKALVIVGDPPGEGGRGQIFAEHAGAERVDHFAEDQPRLRILIRPRKYLPVAQAVAVRAIVLDIPHGDRFDAPGMVDQDLPVNTERLIEEFFVPLRSRSNIPHCEHIGIHEPSRLTGPDLPEVCQRPVIPEQVSVRLLVQLRDPDAVPVRRRFFRHDIHGDLRQIEIGPDADRGGNAGRPQHIPDHGHCEDMGRVDVCPRRLLLIKMQVAGAVDEAFVD